MDRLFHHAIMGQTGTGKSTLILNMVRQDIRAGRGFCLIDPHGDLAEAVRPMMADDAVYWNVADPNCPYGYNPLTRVSERYRPLVASSLIETLKKQWADAWGARMEHLLRYALLALLEQPQATLQDVMPLFLDKAFRRKIMDKVSDPQVTAFWTREFPNMNYKSAADGVAPIANKLGAFVAHPVVRKAVSEPDQPLRFRQIMDDGKGLVANLSRGQLGVDTSNILGGLIVSSIAQAAYSRQTIPELNRRPFFLYIDEFQSFTTSAFADLLSGLRKYRLGLILAHQHIKQLDGEVFEAMLGNIGTWTIFRTGATDAPTIAKQLSADIPEPSDLINLANYEVFARLMIDATRGGVFSARTLPQ
ncbi:MAG: type IV secretion system DNA-binding domain-containing protein [Pseudomonadota bacterium]